MRALAIAGANTGEARIDDTVAADAETVRADVAAKSTRRDHELLALPQAIRCHRYRGSPSVH
jgi:hypothetical protein